MVIKQPQNIWPFLDHFFTYSGAQKSKKRGITAIFDPPNPPYTPKNEVYNFKIESGTHVSSWNAPQKFEHF